MSNTWTIAGWTYHIDTLFDALKGAGNYVRDDVIFNNILYEIRIMLMPPEMPWAWLSYLKRKVDGVNESQLSFVKSNVSSIVDQMDALKSIKTSYDIYNTQYGRDRSY